MIRVGVDAWNLPHDRRGIGRYVRELLAAFDATLGARIACTLVVPEWPARLAARRYRDAAGRALPVVARRGVDRAGLDLLWFPFNGVSWERFALPAVATLNDASPFVLPGYPDAERAPFRAAARRCARILTLSAYCADELARELPYPRERIAPIPLGVAPPRPPAAVALDVAALGAFVLFVGEAEPRKGLPLLAEAVRRLRGDGFALRLVAAGRVREGDAVGDDVVRLGHVDDDTLAALYRGCAVFAYPSRYEGFGLPVLEAMSYGAPVVASNAAAIPEAGGDAALYVPPDDADALAAALRRVALDPAVRGALRERGHARAAAMTWERTAERTLAVFEDALVSRRNGPA